MPFVQIAITAMACQIEDFPKEVSAEGEKPREFKRSCEGALHVRPGTSATITADELEHIKKTQPRLFAAIHVLASDEQLEASAKAAAEPPTVAPATPTTPPDEDSGSGSGDEAEGDKPAKQPGKSGKR